MLNTIAASPEQMATSHTILIVEDDDALRESLAFVLEAAGYAVDAFATPTDALDGYNVAQPGCLVIDLKLPDMDGLQLWDSLVNRGCRRPCILISGRGDIATAVKSIQKGAVDYLEKPFDQARLLATIRTACELDTTSREIAALKSEIETRMQSLTPREREILALVADGTPTKKIAEQLRISEKTVEVHRSHIIKKLHVGSIAELVRLVMSYEFAHEGPLDVNARELIVSRLRRYLKLSE